MPGMPPEATVREWLARRQIALPEGPLAIDGYGDTPEMSRALIDLIASGRKRAGSGLLWAYEHDGQPIAAPGQIEVVIDHEARPVLVTRTERVEVLPFASISAEQAALEGEGDGSLAYWRRAHWAFFGRECARIGREPDESMPVVFSVFCLMHDLRALRP